MLMIEYYRTGLPWNTVRRRKSLVMGLRRVRGWL